jgi:hypothetical protein
MLMSPQAKMATKIRAIDSFVSGEGRRASMMKSSGVELAWVAFRFGIAKVNPSITTNPTVAEMSSARMMARGTLRSGFFASSARSAAPS